MQIQCPIQVKRSGYFSGPLSLLVPLLLVTMPALAESPAATSANPLCSPLNALVSAGPGFESMKGDSIELNKWKTKTSLPGAECNVNKGLRGGNSVACRILKAENRAAAEPKYEETLRAVNECLPGWSFMDAADVTDKRALRWSKSDVPTKVSVRLVDATRSWLVVVNIAP